MVGVTSSEVQVNLFPCDKELRDNTTHSNDLKRGSEGEGS